MTDLLYEVEKQCGLCKKKVTVTKVRNRLTKVRQDTDFCVTYESINPYFYSVWVCPFCGYAAQDTYFEEVPVMADRIRDFLQGRKVNVHYSGIRDFTAAIETYKLALYFAELGKMKASRMAGMYIKMTWLYRAAGVSDLEQKLLSLSLKYYEIAYTKENFPIGNMTAATLEYLICDLLCRLGKPELAKIRLSRIVNDPAVRQEKLIHEMASTLWQNLRNQTDSMATE